MLRRAWETKRNLILERNKIILKEKQEINLGIIDPPEKTKNTNKAVESVVNNFMDKLHKEVTKEWDFSTLNLDKDNKKYQGQGDVFKPNVNLGIGNESNITGTTYYEDRGLLEIKPNRDSINFSAKLPGKNGVTFVAQLNPETFLSILGGIDFDDVISKPFELVDDLAKNIPKKLFDKPKSEYSGQKPHEQLVNNVKDHVLNRIELIEEIINTIYENTPKNIKLNWNIPGIKPTTIFDVKVIKNF